MLAGFGWTWVTDVRRGVQADSDVDQDLKDILMTAVADNPDNRYPSVVELRVALAAYLERIWPGRSWYEPIDE
jgi:hypothetical protein